MAVSSKPDASDFEESMTDIMYRIEGISHFVIENFYTFEYINDNENLVNASEQEVLNYWYSTFINYNDNMLAQLAKSQ